MNEHESIFIVQKRLVCRRCRHEFFMNPCDRCGGYPDALISRNGMMVGVACLPSAPDDAVCTDLDVSNYECTECLVGA